MYDTSYNLVPFVGLFGAAFFIVYAAFILFVFIFTAAEYVGRWFTYKKMGMPGWKGLVPFYNIYCMFDELWNKNEFRTAMICYGVCLVSAIVGELLTAAGTPFLMEGATHEEGGFLAVGIIMLIIGILFSVASVVFGVRYLIKTYRLYVRLVNSFGKSRGWAFGLLFLSPVFFLILGLDKKTVYYGRVDGE